MPRQTLSEYRAKHLLAGVFDRSYHGVELDGSTDWRARLRGLDAERRYVVKVDQAVKGRYKRGLVVLDLPLGKVAAAVAALFAKGFRWCLVEEYQPHEPAAERYLAMKRLRTGVSLLYGTAGGIDVEGAPLSVHEGAYKPASVAQAARALGLPPDTLDRLHRLFNTAQLTFLELNPLLVQDGRALPLDAAIQADGAAASLVQGAWTPTDVRTPAATTAAEAAVAELAAHTPASFNLKQLNPNGQIFVLLSGGGASLVVADEICQLGYGAALGNYGEYSGDPAASEVYAYAREVLSLLLASHGRPKALLIAGGVANFTDVRTTLTGIVQALSEVQVQLRRQHIAVYVRRGGPHAAEGLAAVREFLAAARLVGQVDGPEQDLAAAVALAVQPLAASSAESS